jgi:hypothetical protein
MTRSSDTRKAVADTLTTRAATYRSAPAHTLAGVRGHTPDRRYALAGAR